MLPEQTQWIILVEVLYLLLLMFVALRIIMDTRSVNKTLAYLLLVIFIPVIGMFVYFSFGINYQKRKIYKKKLMADDAFNEAFRLKMELDEQLHSQHKNTALESYQSLSRLLNNPSLGRYNPIFYQNSAEILVNGEQFFPLLLQKLKEAEAHIHIEFYIFEDDVIGNQIKDLLIAKAASGVEVRFIYDDFGSKGIRRSFTKELKDKGVQVFPFNKIRLIALANRLNYRNHRKMVIIDGHTCFLGGINISDKYSNQPPKALYWRDTHLMLQGDASYAMQYTFLADWNFCSNEQIEVSEKFFPPNLPKIDNACCATQIVADGPDADNHNILYSVIHAINTSKKELLITTPYYIPDHSLQQALVLAALSGVDVKLLVPKKGDSMLVSLAAQAYFGELIEAGVRIFRYTKGFVHAKTFVADRKLLSIGTANLDIRSFDLNFEVTALLYDEEKAIELANIFLKDLEDAEEIDASKWSQRSKWRQVVERIFRLFSPFL